MSSPLSRVEQRLWKAAIPRREIVIRESILRVSVIEKNYGPRVFKEVRGIFPKNKPR